MFAQIGDTFGESRREKRWASRFDKPLAACRETVASIMNTSRDDAARLLCVCLAFLNDATTVSSLEKWHGGAEYGEHADAEDFALELLHKEIVLFDALAVGLAFRCASTLESYCGLEPTDVH